MSIQHLLWEINNRSGRIFERYFASHRILYGSCRDVEEKREIWLDEEVADLV